MAVYDFSYEGPERSKILLELVYIYNNLKFHYQESYVYDTHLQQLSVDVSKLSLEDGKTAAGILSFFKPLEEAKLEKGWFDLVVNEEWPGWDTYCTDNFTAACAVDAFSIGALDLKVEGEHLWKTRYATDEFEKGCYHVNLENPENKKQFLVGSIHEHSKKGTAHVGARVLDMAEMHDDRLLRSEVISIAAIMARRMFRSYMVCQHYVPVYLISHAGLKVRILVAYFDDDDRLKIQKSDIISFEGHENLEGLKTVVRWTLCRPVGETEWKIPVKDPYNPGRYIKKSC